MERGVLGALIADTQSFWTVKGRCKPDLFVVPLHQAIVGVMHRLAESNREFSVAAIVSKLGDEATSDGFSPEGYLATLVSEEADASELPEHFGDLEDMYARRQMIRLGEVLMRGARDDNGLSALERLEAAKAAVDQIADPLGVGSRTLYEVQQRVLAKTQDASNREAPVGLNVGLKCVQDLTGPLMPGRLYTLGGPPGSGKSALAFQLATNVGADLDPATGRPLVVKFDSLEMDGEELGERDLAGRTGISADKIERASVNVDELEQLYEASEQVRSMALHIDSATHQSAQMIRSKAMRLKRLRGLDLLVIDHLLYIARPASRKPEHEQIREVMQSIKQLAKDLNIPVVLLAQLKKEYSDIPWQQMRRPRAGDLYGGSSVEQESDVVIFVHRPEYILKRSEPDKGSKEWTEWEAAEIKWRGLAEVVLAKRRGGAQGGVRRAWFDGPKTMFSDTAPRIPLSEPETLF
jgi:replicative DNA helicase